MRTLRPLLVSSAILGLGCGGLFEEPPPPPVIAPAPSPDAVEEEEPVAKDTDLPEGKHGSLPGWLGWVTTADRDAAKLAWTVPAPGGQVVILDAEDWGSKPKPGRALRVLAREGSVPVKFTGVSTVQIGCDGGQPVQVAVFSADEAELAEQAVWILPGGEAASAMPVQRGELSAKRAEWTVGPLLVKLRADDGGAGRLEVFRDADVLIDRGWQVPQDYGLPEPDFTTELGMPGIPVPIAGFQLDAESAALVFEVRSMEGVHWEVFALRAGGMVLASDTYTYLCAG